MSFTRLMQTGFELNSILAEISAISSVFVVTSSTQAKTGTYSARTWDIYSFDWVHSDFLTQCRLGFFVYHNGVFTGDPPIFRARLGSTNILSLQWRLSTGELVAWSGDWDGGGDELATCAEGDFASTGEWIHVGIDFKIDTTGWFYVYINGSPVITFAGDTNDAGTQMDTFKFLGGTLINGQWNQYVYVDDIYIDNSSGEGSAVPAPGYRYGLIKPNADGYQNDWTPLGGGDNYVEVDEIPPDDDTSYVTTDVTAQIDAYDLTSVSIPTDYSIASMIPFAYCKKLDAAATLQLKLGSRLSGTNSVGSAQDLDTSYAIRFDRQTTKPGGGSWAESDANSMQAIIESS